MDNSCILVISDLQIPYHHIDSFLFLKELKKQFKPTRVINIGDEADFNGLNFHGLDPDMKSAGYELIEIRHYSAQLEKIFPQMDLVESNHGLLPKRRAKSGGLPEAMLKSYNDIMDVGPGWKWYKSLDVKLPNGKFCHFAHNYESNALNVSKNLTRCFVQGHHHSKFELAFWSNGTSQLWGATIGCLIDDSSPAFGYNKRSSKRPILGCMVIKNGRPILIEMVLNKAGRWVGWL
jgi:hypothetical protein